jgi:hypothetical protein
LTIDHRFGLKRMSHWAPRISRSGFDANGDLSVDWEVDDIFEDSEAPDDTFVQFAGGNVRELGAQARSADVPQAELRPYAGQVVSFTITFKWNGPPDDLKSSSVAIAVPSEFSTSHGPAPPTLSILATEPKTLQHENRIKIAYSSWSYTDGNIDWGDSGSALPYHHSIKPTSTTYSGTFITDVPLLSNRLYEFKVAVINSFQDNVWHSSSLHVRSAPNFRSLREFLRASGVPLPGGLMASMKGRTRSLRDLLGA